MFLLSLDSRLAQKAVAAWGRKLSGPNGPGAPIKNATEPPIAIVKMLREGFNSNPITGEIITAAVMDFPTPPIIGKDGKKDKIV